MFRADTGMIKRALTGFDDECGDVGVIVPEENGAFCALIDVLGHGREAFEVAEIAKAFLLERHATELVALMEDLHAHLKGSRGAVATLCRFTNASGEVEVVGVGNITAKIFRGETVRVPGRDGIVGYMMPRPKRHVELMIPGDVLMLYSDGVRENFEPYSRPGLLLGDASQIAVDVLDAFGKGDDDASCLVLRCLP